MLVGKSVTAHAKITRREHSNEQEEKRGCAKRGRSFGKVARACGALWPCSQHVGIIPTLIACMSDDSDAKT
eukprot:2097335-Rhodomonas_salina.2